MYKKVILSFIIGQTSILVAGTTIPKPPKYIHVPTDITTTSVKLKFWDYSTNETGFKVWDRNSKKWLTTNLPASSGSGKYTYPTLTGLKECTDYRIVIRAWNSVGSSAESKERAFKTKCDSDGDGIPDIEESNLDTDNDGIPDSLESNIEDNDNDGVFDYQDSENSNPNNDSDGDGVSNIDEKNHNTNPLELNSKPNDLLKITNDDSNISSLHASSLQFFPKNTHPIQQGDQRLWSQGIVYMDNGFYIMSQNIKVKKKEMYTLFNLYNSKGKSVGNVQVDYPSHAQDLSIEKISENTYYLYTDSPNYRHIAKFRFDTSNIDFSNNSEEDIALDISSEVEEIDLSLHATSITASINEEKNKIVSVGYKKTDKQKLKISINDKLELQVLKSFEFNIEGDDKGFYNQGIAMSGEKIFLLRGHYLTTNRSQNNKKLFIFDAKSGKLLTSYTFFLENYTEFDRIETEGLTIKNNELFVCLPTRRKKDDKGNQEEKIRLYKLLDIK